MKRRAATDTQWARSVDAQMHRDRVRWWTAFTAMTVFTLAVGLEAWRADPQPFSIAFVVLVLSSAMAFLRPAIGVYVIVSLTLVGDIVTTGWWPFTKNLSSRESILFLNDKLPINPLEILLVATTVAWILRRLVDPRWRFHRGVLFWPVVVFAGFVFVGFAYGLVTGGDRRVAIFEARPLFYLPWVYILVTNLFTTKVQYRRLLMLSLVAVSIQSIFALVYYRGLAEEVKRDLESLSEHSATIHMDAMFVFFLATILLKCPQRVRWFAGVAIIPVVYAYVLSQRRAAMVALFAGIAVLSIIVFYRRRRAFFSFVPAALIVGTGWVLATWNAVGPRGLAAQAVKSVLFPEQLSEADRSSDLYRQIEKINIWTTIRADPLTGVGFGHKFLQPLPLPDISFFEFWEYLPHHAILWIWLKVGFFGFVAMLFLFGRAVQRGAAAALAVPTRYQAAIVVTGVAYVVMFMIFAYVDIAWDVRSTVFLAVSFALCADFVNSVEEAGSKPRERDLVVVPV